MELIVQTDLDIYLEHNLRILNVLLNQLIYSKQQLDAFLLG